MSQCHASEVYIVISMGNQLKIGFCHNFWLERLIDLRTTRLNYFLQDLFRDIPLDHIWSTQICIFAWHWDIYGSINLKFGMKPSFAQLNAHAENLGRNPKKLKQATGHDWVCQLWDYIFIWLTTSKKEIILEIPRILGNNQEYIQYQDIPTGHCLSIGRRFIYFLTYVASWSPATE